MGVTGRTWAGIARAVGGAGHREAKRKRSTPFVTALKRAGGVVMVPTDTVYGLATALDSAEGVSALYTR